MRRPKLGLLKMGWSVKDIAQAVRLSNSEHEVQFGGGPKPPPRRKRRPGLSVDPGYSPNPIPRESKRGK